MKLPFLLILVCCLFGPLNIYAQSYNTLDKMLAKGEYDRVRQATDKGLAKDSLNPVLWWMRTRLYADTAFGGQQLDTAYRALMSTIRTLAMQQEKDRQRIEKDGLSPVLVQEMTNKLHLRGFERAAAAHSEESYQAFLDRFAGAEQAAIARQRRDSIAFGVAEAAGTYQDYAAFVRRYPAAVQAEEARRRYELLLYEAKTADGTIDAYAAFLRSYPASPHRRQAEEKLYLLYTADYAPETFSKFLTQYPDSHLAERARALRWWLSDRQSPKADDPHLPSADFVQAHALLDTMSWFAVIRDSKIGFMDRSGQLRLPAVYDSLLAVYRCAAVADDFVALYKDGHVGAVDKTGKVIVPFAYDAIEPFSRSVVEVRRKDRYGLAEKTGHLLFDCQFEDIEPLGTRLLAVRKGAWWAVATYYGRLLTPFEYEEPQEDPDLGLILLKRQTAWGIQHGVGRTEDFFAAPARIPETRYDQVVLHEDGFVLLYEDARWTLQNAARQPVVAQPADEILRMEDGWLVRRDTAWTVHGITGQALSPLRFEAVLPGRSGIGVKSAGRWGVLNRQGQLFIQPDYDTLHFVEDKGILLERAGKTFGYFFGEQLTDFSRFRRLMVVRGTVAQEGKEVERAFLIAEEPTGKKALLAHDGTVIIPPKYTTLLPGKRYLRATQGGRTGLLDWQGNVLLPFQYEGLEEMTATHVGVLKGGKFGLAQLPAAGANTIRQAKPEFDALPKPYPGTDSVFIVRQNGRYGLIRTDGQVLAPLQFEQLEYWNDSVILVQQQERWKLFDFKHRFFVPEVFEKFERLCQHEGEQVIKTFRASGNGLLSSRRGRIIAEEYTEITNVGTETKPFYIVEKHISQADLFIVLYAGPDGKIIHKMVLKEEEYEQLQCE